MNRRLAATGAAIAAAYLLTAAITLHVAPRPLRPLFDGFAPPAPYNWVNPPPEFADGNTKPAGATSSVSIVADGSEATGTGTPDGQALVTLPAGAVPAQPGASESELKLEPLDAGTLGPLPDNLQAHSNAYRLTVLTRPGGSAITRFAKPGTVALTAASAVSALLYSADGSSWQPITAQPFGKSPGLTGALSNPGYFLVAGQPQPTTTTVPTAGGGNNGMLIAGVALIVVGIAGAVGLVVSRRRTAGGRRPRVPTGRGSSRSRGRTPPPTAKRKPKRKR